MASETTRKGQKSADGEQAGAERQPTKSISIIESVKALAHHYAYSTIDTEEKLELFLKSWWSKTYNRPLKDPVLMSYTLPELLYEYYDKVEREKAELDRRDQEADIMEESKSQRSLDWAEAEERRELEELKVAKQVADSTLGVEADDKKWVEEKLEEAKAMYGEDFGSDIEQDFE